MTHAQGVAAGGARATARGQGDALAREAYGSSLHGHARRGFYP
ncbi:hypothetical protein [Qipengyuania algicida]|nr:hypothetical protein [Qipengyuania algicida]